MPVIDLGWLDLLLAAGLMLLAMLISWRQALKLEGSLAIGTVRALLQLLAVGWILRQVFAAQEWWMVVLVVAVMLGVAAHTAARRGSETAPVPIWDALMAVGLGSLFTIVYMTAVVIRPEQWYDPRYIIPIGSMIISGSMNSAALVFERVGSELRLRRAQVEVALSLGAAAAEAAAPSRRAAVRAALIPTVNTLMVVGIVHLPGMMTGQLIAGADPGQAVRYQVLVMYTLATASLLTSVAAATLGYRRFFTPAHQLRAELMRTRE